jgi:hypothetical protein
VKTRNIFFDANHQIQNAEFSAIGLNSGSAESFSSAKGANLNSTVDISRFASLLFEIAVDRTASYLNGSMKDPPLCSSIAGFFSQIIEDGSSPKSYHQLSIIEIHFVGC